VFGLIAWCVRPGFPQVVSGSIDMGGQRGESCGAIERADGLIGGEVSEERIELGGAEGFGEIAIHAAGEVALAIALHGVGGDGVDGQVCAGVLLLLADGEGGFNAVHVGHLDIHEDAVEDLGFEEFEDLETTGGKGCAMASLFEQAQGELLVDEVVFGDEDVEDGSDGFAKKRRDLFWGVGVLEGGTLSDGVADGTGDGGAEFGLADGFDEVRGDAEFGAAGDVAVVAGGGEHHDGWSFELLVGADAGDEVEAVGLGHVHVGDDEAEGGVEGVGAKQSQHGGFAAVSGDRAEAPAGEHALEDAAVGGVVVDDEDAEIA